MEGCGLIAPEACAVCGGCLYLLCIRAHSFLLVVIKASLIGASLSEPHTRELVEKKIIVTMCRTFWYCSN